MGHSAEKKQMFRVSFQVDGWLMKRAEDMGKARERLIRRDSVSFCPPAAVTWERWGATASLG